MFSEFRRQVLDALEGAGIEAGEGDLEEPPEGMGDLGYPCFEAAGKREGDPAEIAEETEGEIETDGSRFIRETEAAGPYINFYIDWDEFGPAVVGEVLEEGGDYGHSSGREKALVEHTSINPNASPHIGRARNAIIGDTLVRTMEAAGHDVETHYLVNDTGKQIAMLVYGARKGEMDDLDFDDILDLYVEASGEVEEDESAEEEVLGLLKELEEGDEDARDAFRTVVEKCVEGQREILGRLNIDYDVFDYESDYLFGGSAEDIYEELSETGRVETDEKGREILDLGGEIDSESDVVVLKRSDGTSLYMLRDLAYTLDKLERAPDKNVIVLGEDHKLYQRQVNTALELMGYEGPTPLHYSFVLLSGGEAMSTRKGEMVLLEDFMDEAVERALEEVRERYPDLGEEEARKRAEAIAVAAVRYSIVRVSPEKNVTFDLDEAVSFEGNTGPYLQYSYARAHSILEKGDWDGETGEVELMEDEERGLARLISKLGEVVADASEDMSPQKVAHYVYGLAVTFNDFYERHPVIQSEGTARESRLALVAATAQALENCLDLLGIGVLEEM